jgi:hypothetical protein
VKDVLYRLRLERILALTIGVLILTSVLSSGSILAWIATAHKLKWFALCALVGLALAWAALRGVRNLALSAFALASALLTLGLLSTAWSSFPRLTLERTGALALLFVAGVALAVGAAESRDSIRTLLAGVYLGVVAVAFGGLLVLLFDHDRAIQPATTVMPARYQGLGGGPDTATMVLALGTPLAALVFFWMRRRSTRAAAAVAFAVVLGSIVASDSRGSLVAAFTGLAVLGLVAPRTARARALAVAAVAALLVCSVILTKVPQPLSGSTNPPPPPPNYSLAPAPPPVPAHAARPVYPIAPPRLQDDVGRPPFGVAETRKKPRTLFGTSGRAEAWQGALGLGRQRLLLGYGFGTEDHVFVDRYADFNSNTVENSYIGLFLQLGVVGLLLFIAFFVVLGVTAARSLSRGDMAERSIAASCAAVVAAGLALAVFQSYVLAVGNNATATFWICAFLLAAATSVPTPSRSHLSIRRLLTPVVAVSIIAAVPLVVVGRWERGHRARHEAIGMHRVVADVGKLDSPSLDAFRYMSAEVQCLLYRRGRDPFALELCFDSTGRVVETIDRRTAPAPRIHSLRDDPTTSTLRVDRSEVTRLLHELGVPLRYLPAESA